MLHCSCPNEHYRGDFCENIEIVSDKIPILTSGQLSSSVILEANTGNNVNIVITANPSVSLFPSSNLEINYPSNSTSFQINAQQEGVYNIYYDTNHNNIEPPDDTIAVAVSSRLSSSNYFDNFRLSKGLLDYGCCTVMTSLDTRFCPATSVDTTIQLSSTCKWNERSEKRTSYGLIFVHTRIVNLPLSIIGIQTFESNQLPLFEHLNGLSQCDECNEPKEGQPYCVGSPKLSDMIEILNYSSLITTFFLRIQNILPSGLKIQPITYLEKRYNKNDFVAALIPGKQLSTIRSCESIKSGDGLYYVLKANNNFSVTIDDESVTVEKKDSHQQFCFAYDLCNVPSSNLPSTLNVNVPTGVGDVFVSLQSFIPWKQRGWDFSFGSIALSNAGVGTTLEGESYWNGRRYRSFTQYFPYDISVATNIKGHFKNGHVTVFSDFDGNLFYSMKGNSKENTKCPVSLFFSNLLSFHYFYYFRFQPSL